MRIMELKNTITKIKICLINSSVEMAYDRTSEIDNSSVELNQFEEKKMKLKKKVLGASEVIIKELMFVSSESQEERRGKVGLKLI